MTIHKLTIEGRNIEPYIVHYRRDEASEEMSAAAEKFEKEFGIRFDSLIFFPKSLLNELHRTEGTPTELSGSVTIASHTDETILKEIDILSDIANSPHPTRAQRNRYYSILKSIYRKLPSTPDELSQDDNTLCVGVQREGRILGESMGWLPIGHSMNPHAKRIPYEGGLIVGLSAFPQFINYDRCMIVDGAIASGATLIAIIEKLRSITSTFYIYSVHSSYEGLRAITRYGLSANVNITITVGHATTGMNAKYYAVYPDNTKRVVVGDLGDTISEIKQ